MRTKTARISDVALPEMMSQPAENDLIKRLSKRCRSSESFLYLVLCYSAENKSLRNIFSYHFHLLNMFVTVIMAKKRILLLNL